MHEEQRSSEKKVSDFDLAFDNEVKLTMGLNPGGFSPAFCWLTMFNWAIDESDML